jgi:hypothetical protein
VGREWQGLSDKENPLFRREAAVEKNLIFW